MRKTTIILLLIFVSLFLLWRPEKFSFITQEQDQTSAQKQAGLYATTPDGRTILITELPSDGTAEDYMNYAKWVMSKYEYCPLAIEAYNKALQMRPALIDAYLERGRCKMYTDDVAGAFADLNHAINVSPRNVKAYEYRARAYFKIFKYDQAWKDVHSIERIDKNYFSALQGFVKALELESGRTE